MSLKDECFPNASTEANISPIHEKKNPSLEVQGIFLDMSKLFDRV